MIYLVCTVIALAVVGILTAMAKDSGKQETVNEALQKEEAIRKIQMDIAARPAADPDALLERMRNEDL